MCQHENIEVILNQDFKLFDSSKFDLIIYTGSFPNLEYRSIYFDHYISDNNNGYSVLNTPEDKEITRITNFNILHRNNFNAQKYYYCKEYPANNNEFNELYPIHTQKNIQLYNLLKHEMQLKYPNMIFAGRLGLYKYLNMDQAIQECFKICAKI